jgi:hypothetical protein
MYAVHLCTAHPAIKRSATNQNKVSQPCQFQRSSSKQTKTISAAPPPHDKSCACGFPLLRNYVITECSFESYFIISILKIRQDRYFPP